MIYKLKANYIYPEKVKHLDGIEMVGIAAGTLTTLAYFPQVIATWRARSGRLLAGLWIAGGVDFNYLGQCDYFALCLRHSGAEDLV